MGIDDATDLTPGIEQDVVPAPQEIAYEDAASPEPDQAHVLYDSLQNLDLRGEALGKLLRPGQDLPPGMSWDEARTALFSMQGQQEEEYDPYSSFDNSQPQLLGYGQDGQPVYDRPYQEQQSEQFDPRSLAPVFEHERASIKQEIMQEIMQAQQQQAFDTNLVSGVDAAAAEDNLSEFAKNTVGMMTRSAAIGQPNRAPSELASEIAKQYVADMNSRFVSQGGVPPMPTTQVPGGPIPGEKRPTTAAEAMEWSRRPGVME